MGKVNFADFGNTNVPKTQKHQKSESQKKTKIRKDAKSIDLRDEIDDFITWIKNCDVKDFTGKRRSIVKRIQDYKRPALIEGSIELLVKYMKEKKMKVLK